MMRQGSFHRYSSSGDVSDEQQPSPVALKRIRSRRRSPKSSSKNAVMARQHRLRRKLYVESLESQLVALRADNRDMGQALRRTQEANRRMESQVGYLRALLANSNGIQKLLDSINRGLAVKTEPSLLTDNEFSRSEPGLVERESPQIAEGPMSTDRCETPSRGFFELDLSSQSSHTSVFGNGRLAVHLLFEPKARRRGV